VGERVINMFANGCESYKDFNVRASKEVISDEVKATDILEDRFMGFKHNWQAVRIVEDLAVHRKNETGLGLTPQTVFGLLFHTRLDWTDCKERFGKFCKLRERGKRVKCKNNKFSMGFYKDNYSRFTDLKHFTLEAAIVAIADEIAQRHHDLEDGLRFDLVKRDEILSLLSSITVKTGSEPSELEKCEGEDLINRLSSIVIRFYVQESIDYIKRVVANSQACDLTGFVRNYQNINELQELFDIGKVYPDDDKLKLLLKHRVLYSYQTQGMDGRADFMLRRLFKAYISNPQQLPDSTIRAFFRIYLAKSTSINIKDCMARLNVSYTTITEQSQIDRLSSGQLREILKDKHTKGKHVYKGCLLRAICDLISGMTDHKAHLEYKRLYGVDS
jgi:dGTPase